ncbi:MAG TPA: chloride channel protein [Mycobacteriales bacterium]|nr:chloride channel protein [Mycobacteriales bacterium]
MLAAVLGVPISAAAYGFLKLVSVLQQWLFTDLPEQLGFDRPPWWWPGPLLMVAGLLVGATIRYLPGRGEHSPADGFKAGEGAPRPIDVPGIALAALATLAFGAVLGPEAPLIALGAGLAGWAVALAKRDAPAQATAVIAAAGSFAAIATLLGSPLLGAFLLMEASGLAGPMLGVVLLPGLLAAGVGALIFVGLQSWTGFGAFSLALPDLPPAGPPDVAQFGWAIVIGLVAPFVGTGIRRLALVLRPHVERRLLLLTPLVGLGVAALAVGYAEATGKSISDVLFSGQDRIGPLLAGSADYTVATLLLLIACKGVAYGLSMSAFRGGPVFPAMFLGAAGGMALSHAPGLPLVAGAAMGIGAMSVAMLRLPLTSVLLATLLLFSDGLAVMPLVIVAVVVSHVVTARLTPLPVPVPSPDASVRSAPTAPDTPSAPHPVPPGG